MILKKYNIIVRIIVAGGIFFAFAPFVQAGELIDAVVENKKLLQNQVKDLPEVGNQLLDTGAMLNYQLLNEIEKAEKELKKQGKLLVIPQSIFNDPLSELAKIAPNDEFIAFMRRPEFRNAYNKLWSSVLTPFGASSLPDMLNNLANLLGLVQGKLTTIKGKFKPIVFDIHTFVDLKQAQKALPGTKAINFEFVRKNRDYVAETYKRVTEGKDFDPKGIYAGLDAALKDFDKALDELNKLEKLFKALDL